MNSLINKEKSFYVLQNNDWKKIVANKLLERVHKMRKERMNQILFNKSSFLNDMKGANIITDLTEELLLSEYFDKFFSIVSYDVIENEFDYCCINNQYNISVCPQCSEPVVAIDDKVICINQCFNFNIKSIYFNEKFTLDNLMDLFISIKKEHPFCGNNFIPIFVGEDICLCCEKCLKTN